MESTGFAADSVRFGALDPSIWMAGEPSATRADESIGRAKADRICA